MLSAEISLEIHVILQFVKNPIYMSLSKLQVQCLPSDSFLARAEVNHCAI